VTSQNREIESLTRVLQRLRTSGKVLLAYLYGSFASGDVHARSDIDLAVYLSVGDEPEAIEVVDRILMAADRQVEILRLDDEDESPFMVQRALKGIPLVEPDVEALYSVARRALHEAETIRFRRAQSAA